MRITLNFATRPFTDHGPVIRQLRIGMGVLAFVLILLGWGLESFHQAALRIAHEQAQLDQSIARIRQEQQGYQEQMRQPQNALILTQATFLNDLFEQKSFSWTMVMEDLEPVVPPGVQVTAIEPARAKNGTLTLRLRVTGQRERAVELIRNMEHTRRFVSPRITGESAENAAGNNEALAVSAPSRVTFDVLAEYNPATLEERKAVVGHPAKANEAPAPARAPASTAAKVASKTGVSKPPNAQTQSPYMASRHHSGRFPPVAAPKGGVQ